MNAQALKRSALNALQSKYGLTALVALIWVTFAADIDLIHIFQTAHQVGKLKEESVRVEAAAARVRLDLADLMNSDEAMERFARERYFMKRKNEDIYRIVERAD
jgi:cell division protein DivIC